MNGSSLWVVVTFVCIEPHDIDFFLRITTFSRALGLGGEISNNDEYQVVVRGNRAWALTP